MNTAPHASRCPYCGGVLDALAQRSGAGVCGAAACRHRHDRQRTAQRRRTLTAEVLAQAAAQLPHLHRPPDAVVWLLPFEPHLVELTDEDRQRHRAHLEAVLAEQRVLDPTMYAEPSASPAGAHGARLCAQCRGRCCQHGATRHAFIDAALLQRWQAAHPDATPASAVDAYLDLLPAQHLEGGCLYQTEQGCAIPREQRAAICNGYACDALEEVQARAAREPGLLVAAITVRQDRVVRAAVIEAGATHALHGPAQEPRAGGDATGPAR